MKGAAGRLLVQEQSRDEGEAQISTYQSKEGGRRG